MKPRRYNDARINTVVAEMAEHERQLKSATAKTWTIATVCGLVGMVATVALACFMLMNLMDIIDEKGLGWLILAIPLAFPTGAVILATFWTISKEVFDEN